MKSFYYEKENDLSAFHRSSDRTGFNYYVVDLDSRFHKTHRTLAINSKESSSNNMTYGTHSTLYYIFALKNWKRKSTTAAKLCCGDGETIQYSNIQDFYSFFSLYFLSHLHVGKEKSILCIQTSRLSWVNYYDKISNRLHTQQWSLECLANELRINSSPVNTNLFSIKFF